MTQPTSGDSPPIYTLSNQSHQPRRVLPMFHASGWTFPWAITFAAAAQVRVNLCLLVSGSCVTQHRVRQICLRSVSYPLIWNHLFNSGVTHYCGAPTVQVRVARLSGGFIIIGVAELTEIVPKRTQTPPAHTDRALQRARSTASPKASHRDYCGLRADRAPHRRAREDQHQARARVRPDVRALPPTPASRLNER